MALSEIGAAIAMTLDIAEPEAAADRVRGVLEGGLRDLIHSELRAILTTERPPTKNAPAGQLRIVTSPDVDMRVRSIASRSAPTGSIRTLTRNTLIFNVGCAAFAVRRWHQPKPEPNDVFDAQNSVQLCGDTTLEPGEAIVARAAYDAYDVLGGDAHAAALTVAASHRVPLAWLYDRDSGHAIGIDPARREWLLLCELVSFADAVGDASLAPALGALAALPSHFVRWAATQSLLRLAPGMGRQALQVLAVDPHPQLRMAARYRLAATPG